MNPYHFPITMEHSHTFRDCVEEMQTLLHQCLNLQAAQFIEWNEQIIRELQAINLAILEEFGGDDE